MTDEKRIYQPFEGCHLLEKRFDSQLQEWVDIDFFKKWGFVYSYPYFIKDFPIDIFVVRYTNDIYNKSFWYFYRKTEIIDRVAIENFEIVLNMLPPNIQKGFMFHLDLFS